MPTIRDLVTAIRQHAGVEAAVVLGRDGLVIDSDALPQVDTEQASALVPGILHAADDLAGVLGRGTGQTAILELEVGVAVVSVLSAEAVLLVVLAPGAALGPLLYDLRRHRSNIATLV